RHLLQRACEDDGLAGNGRVALRLLRVEDGDFFGQPFDDAAVMAFDEIGGDAPDHGIADLVERIHLGDRLLVALGHLETGVVKRLPRTIAARQRQGRGLADMAHAKREDETLERNPAALLDRRKEIAYRGFAVTLDLLELQLRIARRQRKNVGGLLHPALVEEILELLLAKAVDVE